MIEYANRHDVVRVYPEYTDYSVDDYIEMSHDVIVIGGYFDHPYIMVGIFRDGEQVWSRDKIHLTSDEYEKGYKWETDEIGTYQGILPIICKEILYPEDYLHIKEPISMITHHIGYPMYDRVQYQAWAALQKSVAERYNAPLISVCGGEHTPLNLSRVYLPSSMILEER